MHLGGRGRQMLPNISVSLKQNAQCPEFPSHIIFLCNNRMCLPITASSNIAVISHEETLFWNFKLLFKKIPSLLPPNQDEFKWHGGSSYQYISLEHILNKIQLLAIFCNNLDIGWNFNSCLRLQGLNRKWACQSNYVVLPCPTNCLSLQYL